MNERTLMRVSVAGALIGIVALFLVTSQLNAPRVNIGEIDSSYISRTVNIEGEVKDLFHHPNGHIFFDMEDSTGKIKIIIWDNTVRALEAAGVNIKNIKNSDMLEITGSVETYRGELEVIPLRSGISFI